MHWYERVIIYVEGKRGRGRPKITWDDVIRMDLVSLYFSKSVVMNRVEWRKIIHVADSN